MTVQYPDSITFEYRRGNPTLLDSEADAGVAGVTKRPSSIFSADGAYVFTLELGSAGADLNVSAVSAAGVITKDVASLTLSASSPTNTARINLCLDGTGDYLYIADGGTRLYTIDVSDPESPSEVDVLTVSDGGGKAVLLNELSGASVGTHLYLLANAAGELQTIDIAFPDSPVLVDTLALSDTADDCEWGVVTPDQVRIIYPGASGQLGIISIASPAAPAEVTPIALPDNTSGEQIRVAGIPVFASVPANTYMSLCAYYEDSTTGRKTYFWMAYQRGVSWSTPTLQSHDEVGGQIRPLLFASASVVQGAALIAQYPLHAYAACQVNDYVYTPLFTDDGTDAGSVAVWDGGLVPRLLSSMELPGVHALDDAVPVNGDGILFSSGPNVNQTTGQKNFVYVSGLEPQGWVDITPYVRLEPSPPTVQAGINGNGPTDRMAQTGTLRFWVDNTENKFSPDHASLLEDFTEGQEFSLSIAKDASTWIWRGWIDEILPTTGIHQAPRAEIACVDAFDAMAKAKAKNLELYVDITSDQVFGVLLNYVKPQPPGWSGSVSEAADAYPFVFDQTAEEEVPIMTEMNRLAMSERGYIYPGQNGTVTFEGRRVRAENTTVALALTDPDLEGLEILRGRGTIINRARGVVYPRRVDTVAQVLFDLNTVEELAPGQSVTISATYTDADQKARRVGALSISPPSTPDEFLFNTAEDGSGTDISGQLGIALAPGANAAEVVLTNNASVVGYVTKFQLKGIGIYSFDEVVSVAENQHSQDRYGTNEETYELPYHTQSAVAQAAAGYIVSAYKEPKTFIQGFQLNLNTLDDLFDGLSLGVGSRVSISEAVTGLNAAEVFVQNFELTILPGSVLRGRYGVIPASTDKFWILGVAGYSELGETTIVGPGFIA